MCLDRTSGQFRDVTEVAPPLRAFASDGTRLYLEIGNNGIEVRDVPPACKR